MFKNLQKLALILGINGFRFIPFWALYRLSDGLYYLLYYVLRIRRKVVLQNLQIAFPNYSLSQLITIEKKTYRNFCDIILETIKGYTLSSKTMARRFQISNPDFSVPFYQDKRSVVGFGGHYANWEWGTALQQQFKHQAIFIYKQLHNRVVDEYVRQKRERHGALLVYKEKMARVILKNRRNPSLYILIADQRPSSDQETRTVNFFNRAIPCFAGPEIMAKTFNFPVIYCQIERIKRGFYQATAVLLTDEPKATADGEITQKAMTLLEKQIRQHPENWMWMHKRWKGLVDMNSIQPTTSETTIT